MKLIVFFFFNGHNWLVFPLRKGDLKWGDRGRRGRQQVREVMRSMEEWEELEQEAQEL